MLASSAAPVAVPSATAVALAALFAYEPVRHWVLHGVIEIIHGIAERIGIGS